jgi:CRP-like cAMP-binding protein
MASVLSRVELFRPLPEAAQEALAARGTRRPFAAGAVLMRQGEPSLSLFVILSGRVRVDRTTDASETMRLAELGPDEIVGEMGVLDAEPRTATVTALEDTQTLELQSSALAIALVESPAVATGLLRLLSRRLRTTDELIDRISQKRRIGR